MEEEISQPKPQLKIIMQTIYCEYLEVTRKEEKIKNANALLRELTGKDMYVEFDLYDGEIRETFDLVTLLGKTAEQDELEMWTRSTWYLYVTSDEGFERTLKSIEDRTPRMLDDMAKTRLDRLMSLGFTGYRLVEADSGYLVEAFRLIARNKVRCYIKAEFSTCYGDC